MRLSRRHRYGAIPPTNVTYTHAINVCQRAQSPDLASAELLMSWAEADAIAPTVIMYSSVIWTAQRCGRWKKALQYFWEMNMSDCDINDVTYNGLLSAMCASDDASTIMELYRDMKVRGHLVSGATVKVS